MGKEKNMKTNTLVLIICISLNLEDMFQS